ncbi:Lethal(2) giant larvae sro7, partial [Basidiobolus ranarum]
MSLFSKIKNVIQKEQHKYTAPSMSSSLTPDSFDLTELALYGLPSTVSTLAYDPVQSLLAVGTFQGTILLFGKPGITAHLALPESAAILFLSFQVGEARLVSVDSHQNLVVFNLESFEPSFVHKVASPVSCMDLLLGTEYMLLGLRNGYIEMYNISRGFKSGYVIEPISIESENNNSPSLCVVAVQVHPIDTNQLLIGYSSGLIALWDLRSRRVVRYYQYGGPSTVVAPKFWNFKEDDTSTNYGGHLTVIAWRPDGAHFVSGYDDGTIVFWDIKNDKKPLLARTISEPDLSTNYDGSAKAPVPAGSVKREPIFKILWCSVSDSEDTHIAIAGGSLNQDLRGIRVFDYQGKDYRAPRRLRMLAVSEDLADMFVFPRESPWYNGTRDPAAIAIIIPSGAVKLHEFNAGFSPCSIPSELQWLDPRISSAKLVVNCPDYLYKNLVFGYEHPTSYGGIVKGGIQASVDSENLKKLMLTIHQDGSLRIWKCSHSNLILLKHITFVPGSIHPTISKSQISFVDPCFENGQLVIGFNSGHVLQYWFKMNEDETSYFNFIVESVENLAPTQENMNGTESNGHLPLKKATTIATRTYMPEPASSANKSIANASSQNRLRSSSQPAPDTSKEIPSKAQATNAPPRTTSLSLESPSSEIVVADTSKENMSPREPTKLNIMQGPLHSEPQTKDTMVMSHQDSVDVSTSSLTDDIRDFDSPRPIQNNISNTTPHSSPKSNSESLKSEASNSTLEDKLDDTSLQSSRKNSDIRQGDIPTNGQDSISNQDENHPNNSPLSHPSRDLDNGGVKSESTDEHRSHEGLADFSGEANTNNGNSAPTLPYSASEKSVNDDDKEFTNLLRLSPNYLNMGSYPLVPSLLIRCHQGTVNNIVSTEIGLLALSDEEGTLSIVDTIGQKLIFYQDYSDQSHPSEAEVGAEAYSVNSVTVDRITAMMFVESYTKETDHMSIKLVTGSFRG